MRKNEFPEAPGGSRGVTRGEFVWRCAMLAIAATLMLPQAAEAQRPRRSRGEAAQGEKGESGNYAAFQLLRKGQELLDSGEHDRG